MPKIYLKSKDVKGVEVVKYDGVCYTRTGVTSPASRVTLTPTSSVTPFYVDCDGCLLGEQVIASGATLSVPNTADEIQIKFDSNTPNDTATIELQDPTGVASTCAVTLSVNAAQNLVFDALASGNGPWEFTTVPMTISYVDCNTMKYDVTLAGLGSYILTLSNTGSGGSITQGAPDTDTVELTTTIEDVDVATLDATTQGQIIASQEEAIEDSLTNDGYDSSQYELTTTIESGSIVLKTLIKFLADIFEEAKTKLEAAASSSDTTGIMARLATKLAAKITDTTLVAALTDPAKLSTGTKTGDSSKNLPTTGGGTTTPTTSGGDGTTTPTSYHVLKREYSGPVSGTYYFSLTGILRSKSHDISHTGIINVPADTLSKIDSQYGTTHAAGLHLSLDSYHDTTYGDSGDYGGCFEVIHLANDVPDSNAEYYGEGDISLATTSLTDCTGSLPL